MVLCDHAKSLFDHVSCIVRCCMTDVSMNWPCASTCDDDPPRGCSMRLVGQVLHVTRVRALVVSVKRQDDRRNVFHLDTFIKKMAKRDEAHCVMGVCGM